MASFLLCCSLSFYVTASTVTAPLVVTSIVKMAKLADFEQDLLTCARHRASHLPPQFVNFVSSVEAQYSRHHLVSNFIDFPINQYRLIRRFSYDWPMWRQELRSSQMLDQAETIQSNVSADFLTSYDALSKKHANIDHIDGNNDSELASYTISRLHILYGNQSRLLQSDEPTECPPFTEIEILELCLSVLDLDEKADSVYYASHWFSIFVEKMEPFLPYSSPMFLVEYVMKHSDTYGRPEPLHQKFVAKDAVEKLEAIDWFIKEHSLKLRKYFKYVNRMRETKVCRHAEDRSQAGNHCFMFRTPRAPYAPFRYEILHRDPYIAVVHNFIPRQLADEFISAATSRGSHVSRVTGGKSNKTGDRYRIKVTTRLSETTLFNHSHHITTWIDLRIEEATLLLPHSQPMRFGIRDGEQVQLTHYGLSGHYKEHHDYFRYPRADRLSNRLATVLVYLSDVKSGGHTAFPNLKVSFKPRTGSALVWYNFDPWNGKPLRNTLHVACPVNIGKKWIINRWVNTHNKIRHSLPVTLPITILPNIT